MRNAYSGYTYQKHVTLLMLSIMDVERNISKIEIEAKTDDNFDDLIVTTSKECYQFQIKDFETISLKDLSVQQDKIHLQGKPHKLSSEKNIIFFKYLAVKPNDEILGFPCYKLSKNVFIVSLSRTQIEKRISNLYRNSDIKIINKFKKSKLSFEKEIEKDDYSKYRQNSQQRFDNGILTFEDIAFIKEKKLKPYDIAMFSDGNYTSLPDATIFKIYEAKQITYHFKKIIYNTLIKRTANKNYFYSLHYHPGNVLSMIKLYRNDKEFKTAIDSFKKFMDLSMFELKLK